MKSNDGNSMMKSRSSTKGSAKTIRSSSKTRSRSLSSSRMKVRKFLRRCFLFTLIDKIIHSSFLASFSKSVGFRTSLRQLLWRVFGPPLQHTDIFISTGVGQSNLKLPTPTSPTDYTCSSTSQVATSLHTDSSTTSPDSDCGLEMKSGPVETPSIESHPDTNPSLRRRKTHPPQTATT